MAVRPLTEEMALRIGLALRELPDLSLDDWMGTLIRAVGLPLSPERCQKLRLNRLRRYGSRCLKHLSDEQLRNAIACLRGQGFDLRTIVPQPDSYAVGDIPGSLRVACASNRGDRVDAAFGNCARYLVYQVSASEARLIDVREAPASQGLKAIERYEQRARLLDDCHVLYALTLGAGVAASLVRTGIHPLRSGVPQPSKQLLNQLQQVMADMPPPWMANLIQRSNLSDNYQESSL